MIPRDQLLPLFAITFCSKHWSPTRLSIIIFSYHFHKDTCLEILLSREMLLSNVTHGWKNQGRSSLVRWKQHPTKASIIYQRKYTSNADEGKIVFASYRHRSLDSHSKIPTLSAIKSRQVLGRCSFVRWTQHPIKASSIHFWS